MANRSFNLIENYIYIYLLDKYVIIPTWPDLVTDSLGSTFAQSNILARTAPIYSYSYSGPRSVMIDLSLHRDLMASINKYNTAFLDALNEYNDTVVKITDDYIDTLIKYLLAMALPSYAANTTTSKMVNPPIVAVRLGNDIFVKGIVSGPILVNYSGPISKNGKYSIVTINFTIIEIDPQDAETIAKWGSFRGLETALNRHMRR